MFDSAELDHKIDKLTYKHEVPHLREALLNVAVRSQTAREIPRPRSSSRGVDGAGKGETVNLLNEWMDPRYLQHVGLRLADRRGAPRTRACGASGARCRRRARSASSSAPGTPSPSSRACLREDLDLGVREAHRRDHALRADARRRGRARPQVLVPPLEEAAEEAPRDARRRARRRAGASRTATGSTSRSYDAFARSAERAHARRRAPPKRRGSSSTAPTTRYRNLTVGRTILAAVRERLAEKPDAHAARHARRRSCRRSITLHGARARSTSIEPMTEQQYDEALEKLAGPPRDAARAIANSRRAAWSSCSKATTPRARAARSAASRRRSTRAGTPVIPIAAPTEEERAQPYLWRFWRHVPRLGRFAIFDRSWYGRVLVERVEGFCAEPDWMRAYGEINDFEEQLVEHGTRRREVLARHRQGRAAQTLPGAREDIASSASRSPTTTGATARSGTPTSVAVCDMVDRTSTEYAPWTLVEANDKYYARIKILRTMCKAIEDRFDKA